MCFCAARGLGNTELNDKISKQLKKTFIFLQLLYLLLLFVPSPFGSFGTVDRFGLRTVYEV